MDLFTPTIIEPDVKIPSFCDKPEQRETIRALIMYWKRTRTDFDRFYGYYTQRCDQINKKLDKQSHYGYLLDIFFPIDANREIDIHGKGLKSIEHEIRHFGSADNYEKYLRDVILRGLKQNHRLMDVLNKQQEILDILEATVDETCDNDGEFQVLDYNHTRDNIPANRHQHDYTSHATITYHMLGYAHFELPITI